VLSKITNRFCLRSQMKKIAWSLLCFLFLGCVWGSGPTDVNRQAGKGIEIPPNAQLNLLGNGWECSRGFRRVGTGCERVELPANAQLNLLGNGWECSRGFRRVGNGCEKVDVPPNAQINLMGNGWECSRGFRRVGNGCERVGLPPNAQINLMGNGWECSRGFKRIGNGCERVEVPTNAQLNPLGNGWECSRGFRRVGNGCERVEVPANAQLNPLGNGWTCMRGFKQVSSECKEMTQEEVRILEAREKAVLSAIAARRARLAAGNSCETESRSGAEVCLSLVNVVLDCDKNSYSNYYNSCEATITYELDTNYKGRSYLDVEVECRVDIEYSGRGFSSLRSDSQRKDESTSLHAGGSESETLRFDFLFSSYEQVTRAVISSYKCEIDDVELR